MARVTAGFLVAWLLCGACECAAVAIAPIEEPLVDRHVVEQATEAFDDELLDIAAALSRREPERFERALHEDFAANGLRSGGVDWIDSGHPLRQGVVRFGPGRVKRSRFIRDAVGYLREFRRIDDLRFKVVGFEIAADGSRAVSEIRLLVQGRASPADRATEITDEPRGDDTDVQVELARADSVPAIAWRITRWITRSRSIAVATAPLFTDATALSGLNHQTVQPLRSLPTSGDELRSVVRYRNYGGVAAADFDGDGDIDLFVPREGPDLLYENNGDGSFQEIGKQAGVANTGYGRGAVWFDFDGDGDLDPFVVNGAPGHGERSVPATPNALYRNDGKHHFTNVTRAAGLEVASAFSHVAVGDYDGDGWLDLYVVCFGYAELAQPDLYHDAKTGCPNRLFRNRGDGTFAETGQRAGVADRGWGLAAAWADADRDGDLDLFVANDFGRDVFYRNEGNGTFVDVAPSLGMDDPGFGMGATWGDFDNDGWLDLYVSNMSSTAGARILRRPTPDVPPDVKTLVWRLADGNRLYRNRGDGTFEDVAAKAGVALAGWAWGSCFLDADGDGNQDLYVANGFISGSTKKDL